MGQVWPTGPHLPIPALESFWGPTLITALLVLRWKLIPVSFINNIIGVWCNREAAVNWPQTASHSVSCLLASPLVWKTSQPRLVLLSSWNILGVTREQRWPRICLREARMGPVGFRFDKTWPHGTSVPREEAQSLPWGVTWGHARWGRPVVAMIYMRRLHNAHYEMHY